MELLTVVAIMVIIAGISVSALRGQSPAGRVGEALYSLEDALVLSFHYARSKGLPVWVAVAVENAGTDEERIRIRQYTTKDGERTGGAASELIRLGRDRVIKHVRIAQRGSTTLKDAIGNEPRVPQMSMDSDGGWIFISPAGEVRASTGVSNLNEAPVFPGGNILRDLEVGLVAARSSGSELSIVQFSGLTGASRIYQP